MPYPELICLQTRTDTGTAGACKLRLEEMIDQRSWLAAGWDQPIDVLMQLVRVCSLPMQIQTIFFSTHHIESLDICEH